MNAFKNTGHLFRLAGVFLAGLMLFLTIRGFLVPQRFRAVRALSAARPCRDIAAHPVKFAGHQTCENCHTDVLDVKKGQARACELRGLPWAPGEARRRSGVGHAGETGHGRALRACHTGERSQAEELSAGRSGGTLERGCLRNLP